jgi:hypothetical protein
MLFSLYVTPTGDNTTYSRAECLLQQELDPLMPAGKLETSHLSKPKSVIASG